MIIAHNTYNAFWGSVNLYELFTLSIFVVSGDDHPNSATNTDTDNYQYISESEIAMKELAELEVHQFKRLIYMGAIAAGAVYAGSKVIDQLYLSTS